LKTTDVTTVINSEVMCGKSQASLFYRKKASYVLSEFHDHIYRIYSFKCKL